MADDEDTAKTKYDEALGELAKLFCGIDEVVIHQYGFVIFYLPVYELLLEIKRELDKVNFSNYRYEIFDKDKKLQITFENHNSDTECCNELMRQGDLLKQKEDKLVLHLGLSEPPSSLCQLISEIESSGNGSSFKLKGGKPILQLNNISSMNNEPITDEKKVQEYKNEFNKKFCEIPFIRNFPLWGMALANNPKIRKIEYEQSDSFATQSGIRYWDHFASNVTLLSKETVDQFTYSIHSKTSTTFLEFKNRIAKEKNILAIEPGNDNKKEGDKKEYLDEFDLIFRNHADIALTHQPWVGIKRGSSLPTHRDLEIVYTHVWGIGRKPASALYFFVEKPNKFHKTLAYLFAETMMQHVKNVSEAWTPRQMHNMSIYYCGTVLNEFGRDNKSQLPHNCKKCEAILNKSSSQSLEDVLTDEHPQDIDCANRVECREETAVGYQVCIHNQIFFDPLLKYKDHDDNKGGDIENLRILPVLGEITR